jgi:hypothetical protein
MMAQMFKQQLQAVGEDDMDRYWLVMRRVAKEVVRVTHSPNHQGMPLLVYTDGSSCEMNQEGLIDLRTAGMTADISAWIPNGLNIIDLR